MLDLLSKVLKTPDPVLKTPFGKQLTNPIQHVKPQS